MSDALVLSGQELVEIRALAKDLSGSRLLPTPLQGKPSDVLAIVLAGKELGLGPMQSVRGLEVIQGKIAMTSGLIGALILSSPHCEYLIPVESTDAVATYETKRKGAPQPVRMSFTMENAKTAGLSGKDNYKKNPAAMLLARCISKIGRAVYPDKCLGVYDRDSGELDEPTEREVTGQRAHVDAVKEALRAKPEIVDAEIVPTTLADRIRTAATLADLTALGAEIKALPAEQRQEIKPVYEARRAEVA